MTPYKLEVLQLLEIKECTISCPDCQTQITVRLDRPAPIPNLCPSCQKKLDADLSSVLLNLREAHISAKATSFGIEFQIREEMREKGQQ
jgi:hypothetical protein